MPEIKVAYYLYSSSLFYTEQGRIQSWTLGGVGVFSCEKFLNTIVYYRKRCRLGDMPPSHRYRIQYIITQTSPSITMAFIELQESKLAYKFNTYREIIVQN